MCSRLEYQYPIKPGNGIKKPGVLPGPAGNSKLHRFFCRVNDSLLLLVQGVYFQVLERLLT